MHACSIAPPENAFALPSDASVCTHLITENCTNFQIASAPTQKHICAKIHWWPVGYKSGCRPPQLAGRLAQVAG